MKAKDIRKLALDLKAHYKTNDPFELAEKYGIKVLLGSNFTADCKAYTIKSDYYPTVIVINEKLSPRSQYVLCAHELGHALLHNDGVNHFAITKQNAFTNVEYEANLFAVSLLFNEEDFNCQILSLNNYLLKEILDYNIDEL